MNPQHWKPNTCLQTRISSEVFPGSLQSWFTLGSVLDNMPLFGLQTQILGNILLILLKFLLPILTAYVFGNCDLFERNLNI